jgi:hypothetical protein
VLEKATQRLVEMHEDRVLEYMVETPSAGPKITESPGDNISSCSSEKHPDNIKQHRHRFPEGTAEIAHIEECDPYLSPDTMDRIVQMGRNSPGSRPGRLYAGPPVGYIPADQPGGPRDLPPDRYNCPVAGCRLPSGPTREGYNRRTLGSHIRLSHGGPDRMGEVRQGVRERVMALRFERARQGVGPAARAFPEAGDPVAGLQRQTDGLVRDMDEIRGWEHSRRFAVPTTTSPFQTRRAGPDFSRQPAQEGGDVVVQGEGAEEERGSGSPASRIPRTNCFACQRDECSLHSREEVRSPHQQDGAGGSLTSQRLREASRVKCPRSVGPRGCRRLGPSRNGLNKGHCDLGWGGNSMDVD